MAAQQIVRSDCYPYLEVRLTIRGVAQTAWAYVDTGFEGYLAIPLAAVSNLGEPDREANYELADGSEATFALYFGIIEIVDLGNPAEGRILATGAEYLLGREAIDSYRLTFDRGQTLIAEA